MAEFKLGRIRFVWQGAWTANHTYVADDVVNNGGKSYICVVNHTSSPEFTTDFTSPIPKWNIISDGTSWRGNWEPTTTYNPGDIVKYGALVYLCEIGHNSDTYVTPTYNGLETDIEKWTEFATSFDWKGNWQELTRYKLNDLVKYGSYTYVCKLHHISSSELDGLENDSSNWDVFNSGILYLGLWDGPGIRYKVNDVVKVGADLYICTYQHVSGSSFTDLNWSMLLNGLEYEDSWNNSTPYQPGDIVTYGGYTYVAKTLNTNKQPTANLSDWDVFTTGFNFRGDWSNVTDYKVGEVIRLGSASYVAKLNSTGQDPTNVTYWDKLNSGFRWTNNPESFTQVSGTNITGTGTGAKFDVTKTKTVYTVSVSSGYAGSGYSNGNKIRIPGSSVGGLSTSNDIVITITGTTLGVIDTITHAGNSTSWKSGVSYLTGDVVIYGASSFVCVQTHTAGTLNRPDNDNTGDYWNVLALGSETFTLTTQGDLVYYGENGPTRLPIGVDGQIIRSTDGIPQWANYGLINNVVYVGPLGANNPAPTNGLTIDKPWSSVRYACEQIEDGYLNPNAKSLLRKNKQFLIKEVNNYLAYISRVTITNFDTGTYEYEVASTAELDEGMPIVFDGTDGGVTAGTTYYVKTIVDYTHFTISNTQFGIVRVLTGTPPGSGMIGNLSYNSASTERDAGTIVDALVYDICRGGTLNTTNAANAYFTAAGNAYITTGTSELVIQFVKAQTYMRTLVANVLNNTAPASNYQTLNGILLADRAQQIIDASIAAENNAITKADELIAIISEGLTAGSNTAVPPAINPNTTIFIKTGTYREVLPIVVPEYAALVGDELRTSVIQPAFAVDLLVNDKPKTVAALNRIKNIIPDLVSNTTITPTSGNNATQVTTLPEGNVGTTLASTKVADAADVIKQIIDIGLTGVPNLVLTNPTGYGTSLTDTAYAATGNLSGSTSTYDNARIQIVQNYDFIKAEINAYMAENYSTEWNEMETAGRASTPVDVGHILDAIRYDITYGVNTQALIAGSAYYSNYILQIRSSGLTSVLASLARLKTILGEISTKTSVTPTTTTLINVAITGTAGQFSCDATTLYVGQTVKISGTLGGTGTISGYTNPTTYYIVTTNGTTTFTLSTSFGGSGVTTTAGTPTGITYVVGNTVTQITTGSAGNSASAVFVQDKVDDVIDWINNNAAPTAVLPALSWVDSTLYDAYTVIQSRKTEIQDDVLAWVYKFYQGVSFNSEICYRDAGYMVDATCYDMMFGSNFASIVSGISYFRNTSSANEVLSNERQASVGAANFLKHKLRRVAAITASSATEIIIDDITGFINGGSVPSLRWPAPSTIEVGYQGAATLLWDNKEFIKAEVIRYITDNYPLVEYSQETCARDVGFIIDSLRYDLTYGGNFASKQAGRAYYSFSTLQIDINDKSATLAAYGFLKTLVQSVATDVDVVELQVDVPQVRADTLQTIGSGAASTTIGTLVDVITNIINLGLTNGVPTVTITTIAAGTTFTTSSNHGLYVGDEIIPQNSTNGFSQDTIYYIVSTPGLDQFTLSESYGGTPKTNFTSGSGLTLMVETTSNPSTSWVNSSLLLQHKTLSASKTAIKTTVTSYITNNYPTLVYNSATCERDIGYIIDAVGFDLMFNSNFRAVKTGISYYRAAASSVVGDQKAATVSSFRYLKNVIADYIGTDITAVTRSNLLMTDVINIINNGAGDTPEINGTLTYNNVLPIIKGAEIIRANKEFLSNEATAYISDTYSSTVTTTTSGSIVTTSGNHNLSINDPVIFTGVLFGNIVADTVYYVKTVPSTTTFTISETLGGVTFTLVGASGTATVTYAYDEVSCQRDMAAYVESIVYDLQFTGTYKALRSANLYLNAVKGSTRSDMFYVRNSTGLRNMTFNGLSGELSEENEFGTKRPTAGSAVSLDPGFGPNDAIAWITNKSPYVQNVTNFGSGCTGLKIDGALHSGGNRSVVANDFTQILSDGIGVWCSGANSLTELVSVFCYYTYSGYLADLGGRIRATNGNSSYGRYGVIAEGTDTGESPLYAILDNHSQQAQISNVLTDATDAVLRFEFGNAGTHYTNTVHDVSGAGFNVTTIADEFRDNAVFETRLIDLDDSNGYGGENYGLAINAAQEGTTTQITIANTDTALSSAYVGMRIILTAGSGVGQYANILTYNNGTKVALVYKDSFTNLTVTNTTVTSNLVTVASTATLYDNMPIYLGTAIGNLTANTLYYVLPGFTATQFRVSTSANGSAVSLATASGSVTLYAAGWDHAVPGTAITTPLDLTTNYIIEPRISYTVPGYTATARTSATSSTWGPVTYANGRYVSVTSNGTDTQYSTDGKNWVAGGNVPSASYVDVVFGGGSGASAYAVVGGLGGFGAVLSVTLGVPNSIGAPGAGQIASVNIVDGGHGYTTAPTIVISGTGAGASATCTVLDGVIQEITMVSNGAGYSGTPTATVATDRVTDIVVTSWGSGYTTVPTITLSGGGASVQATATATVTNTGVSNIEVSDPSSGYTSTPTVTITDSNAKYVALSNGSTTTAYLPASSSAATNWTVGNSLPASTFTGLAYGNGLYIAVGGTAGAASSTDGITWVSRTNQTLASGTYSDVVYGNGIFLAIGTGSNQTSYTTNGITWLVGGTLPAVLPWASVAYGNGRFVAIGNSTTLSTVVITGTAGQFSCASSILKVGDTVTISGTLGGTGTISGYANPTTYYIVTTNGTTTFTLSTTKGGSGVTTTAGTPTGLTYTLASNRVAISYDKGLNWVTPSAGLPAAAKWTKISYGQGLFFAVAQGTTTAATSPDGINWTVRTMPGSATNWLGLAHGNPSNTPLWVATSNTSGQVAASINTGAQAIGRASVSSGVLMEIRMLEPGSSYPKGSISATTVTTNLITANITENLVDSQPIVFTGMSETGLSDDTVYYVIGSTITSTQFKVSLTAGSSTAVTLSTVTGLTATYRAGPIITQIDPNKTITAATRVRMGDAVLGNPSFSNRGTGNTTATATTQGDGYADLYQPSTYISVSGLFSEPIPGSNVEFASIPNAWYKLVSVRQLIGEAGNYSATLQISPGLTVLNAPAYGDAMTITNKYSQVRLTGHDFLYIGTGNAAETNYPFVDPTTASQANQEYASGGGRVFFTSTDQDGNFNVGNLFGVQQATGTATLNADAFNLSGLQSLQLGGISLGVGSAVITQFSTDPYFTANSDNIVPTQRAIKSYITAQIGGGQSSLNVNTLTSGVVYVAGDTITTTSGGQLNITAKMNFTGGVDGAPVALGFFLQR